MRTEIVAAAAVVTLTACGPSQVRVPDASAPMTPPPEEAMQEPPTAETEGTGTGYVPDLETGSRGEVMRALGLTAEYGLTCRARWRTLHDHIDAYLDEQRPPQDR